MTCSLSGEGRQLPTEPSARALLEDALTPTGGTQAQPMDRECWADSRSGNAVLLPPDSSETASPHFPH